MALANKATDASTSKTITRKYATLGLESWVSKYAGTSEFQTFCQKNGSSNDRHAPISRLQTVPPLRNSLVLNSSLQPLLAQLADLRAFSLAAIATLAVRLAIFHLDVHPLQLLRILRDEGQEFKLVMSPL